MKQTWKCLDEHGEAGAMAALMNWAGAWNATTFGFFGAWTITAAGEAGAPNDSSR